MTNDVRYSQKIADEALATIDDACGRAWDAANREHTADGYARYTKLAIARDALRIPGYADAVYECIDAGERCGDAHGARIESTLASAATYSLYETIKRSELACDKEIQDATDRMASPIMDAIKRASSEEE